MRDIANDINAKEQQELAEQAKKQKTRAMQAAMGSAAGLPPADDFDKLDAEEEKDAEAEKKLNEGIKIKIFMQTCLELKEKHQTVAERVLDALELPVSNKTTVVDWTDFLRLQTILRYYTATREQYLDFWMKVSRTSF